MFTFTWAGRTVEITGLVRVAGDEGTLDRTGEPVQIRVINPTGGLTSYPYPIVKVGWIAVPMDKQEAPEVVEKVIAGNGDYTFASNASAAAALNAAIAAATGSAYKDYPVLALLFEQPGLGRGKPPLFVGPTFGLVKKVKG